MARDTIIKGQELVMWDPSGTRGAAYWPRLARAQTGTGPTAAQIRQPAATLAEKMVQLFGLTDGAGA